MLSKEQTMLTLEKETESLLRADIHAWKEARQTCKYFVSILNRTESVDWEKENIVAGGRRI